MESKSYRTAVWANPPRIGQTEVCHLWNLVGDETREGDVYHTLLEKLDEARKALGGKRRPPN